MAVQLMLVKIFCSKPKTSTSQWRKRKSQCMTGAVRMCPLETMMVYTSWWDMHITLSSLLKCAYDNTTACTATIYGGFYLVTLTQLLRFLFVKLSVSTFQLILQNENNWIEIKWRVRSYLYAYASMLVYWQQLKPKFKFFVFVHIGFTVCSKADSDWWCSSLKLLWQDMWTVDPCLQ